MNNESVPLPILIVDDDDAVLRTVRHLLTRAGYNQVVVARNGDECLRIVKEGFRGLILMDVMMPQRDGWSTIRAMKSLDLLSGNMICMLTAVEDPDPQNADLAASVFDYLPKPFDFQQLMGIIQLACTQVLP